MDHPLKLLPGSKRLEPEPEGVTPLKFTNLGLTPEANHAVFFSGPHLRFFFLRGGNFDIM
jgi:hypothetical protein